MARKEYESPQANLRYFSEADVITASGVVGESLTYGSFDTGWISQ